MNKKSKILEFIDSLPEDNNKEEFNTTIISIGAGLDMMKTNGEICKNSGDCSLSTNELQCYNTGNCDMSTNKKACSNEDPTPSKPVNTGNCASQSQLCQ